MKLLEEFKALWFFYGLELFYGIGGSLIAAYWIVYFFGIGLTFYKITILFAAMSLAKFLFEIPTGAIADVFGRKISVMIFCFMLGLSLLGIYISGSNFLFLSVFAFLAGLSETFRSGAEEAWFYDYLKQKKKIKMSHKAFGRKASSAAAGTVIGPLIAGFLVVYGISFLILLQAVSMIVIGFYVMVFGKEQFKKKRVKIKQSIYEMIETSKEGLKFSMKNQTILILLLTTLFFFVGAGIETLGYQAIYLDVGLPLPFFGYILSLTSLFGILIFNYSEQITSKLGHERNALAILLIFCAIFVFIFATSLNFYLVVLVGVVGTNIFWLCSPYSPLFRNYFNKFVKSKIRATVISLSSIFTEVAALIGFAIFGLLADTYGIRTPYLIAVVFYLLAAFTLFKIKKKQ